MKKEERTFKHWKVDSVAVELGILERDQCDLLDDWLEVEDNLQEMELMIAEKLRKKAKKLIAGWNEMELQTKFIAPITELVDFDNLEYFFASFSERKLEAKYKGIPLKGKVDWMVAMGRHDPFIPFFFVHEYKKQKGFESDPEGQLLATMLAAHVLNQTPPQPTLFNPFPKHDKDMPIYGCYIIGRLWFFVVLYQGRYCSSDFFDSMKKKDLAKIINILKKQKQMIIDRIEASKTN